MTNSPIAAFLADTVLDDDAVLASDSILRTTPVLDDEDVVDHPTGRASAGRHDASPDRSDDQLLLGTFLAMIDDVADPEARSRVRVRLPEALGMPPLWAEPALDPLSAYVAEPESLVDDVRGARERDADHLSEMRMLVDEIRGLEAGADVDDPLRRVVGLQYRVAERLLAHERRLTARPVLPEVGQQVWIVFEAGDPGRPVWVGRRLPDPPPTRQDVDPGSTTPGP